MAGKDLMKRQKIIFFCAVLMSPISLLNTCVVFSILGEEKSLVIGICQNLHSEITCVNYLTFSQKSVCAMEITHLRWLGI